MSRLRVHGSLIVYTVYVPCVYTVLRTRHPRFLNTRLNILTHVEYHDLYWILRARHQRESNTRKRERERARAREILFFIVGIWKSWNYSTRTLTSSTRRGNNFVSLFPVRMWATSSVYSSRKCLDEISIWIVRRPNYGLTFSFVVFFSHRARFNLPPSFFFFFFIRVFTAIKHWQLASKRVFIPFFSLPAGEPRQCFCASAFLSSINVGDE